VITPAHNVVPFVGETIESVLGQTAASFEMIIVDDGSRDRTAEVVDRFAKRDGRIVLIQTANRGVSSARNTAMSHARGQYFALLDADDIWHPTFLAEQLAMLEARPEIAVVTGNARNLGGPFDGEPVRRWPTVQQELTMQDMVEKEDSVFIMSMFRRTVFDAIGGFDTARARSEDYHFWLRAARSGFRFVANPTPLGFYRRRHGSASSDEIGMLAAIASVLEEVQHSCSDPATALAITRQIERFRRRQFLCCATTNLLNRDYAAAASHFEAFSRLNPTSAKLSLLTLLARTCPSILGSAYRTRLSWLQLRRNVRRRYGGQPRNVTLSADYSAAGQRPTQRRVTEDMRLDEDESTK
jgi:hypothetical protein